MFKVPNEFKVGVVATIAIVLAVLGYNLMRGKNSFNRDRIYFARYAHVEGLAIAAHVRYNGMNIGRVQEMNLDPDGSGNIIVSMNVSSALRIPKASLAKIVQIDLFGTKAVDIVLSNQQQILASGDTLSSAIEGDVISDVKNEASSLLASLDSVVTTVHSTFNAQTRENIQKSVASIQHSLNTFDQSITNNQNRLEHIFSDIESITHNLDENRDQITSILTNINAITDSIKRAEIASTMREARNALDEVSGIMQKINQGEGTMGMLVNNDSLYTNLNNSAESFDALMKDMKEHPSRYVQVSVFGKKDKTQPPK